MKYVQEYLPDSRSMRQCYLDLAASVRTFIQNCETTRNFS